MILFSGIYFGITLGATYALVALGFSMQFRAMNLLNFAHGESFMLGAFDPIVVPCIFEIATFPFMDHYNGGLWRSGGYYRISCNPALNTTLRL